MWYHSNDKTSEFWTEKTARIAPASMSRETESMFPKHIGQMQRKEVPHQAGKALKCLSSGHQNAWPKYFLSEFMWKSLHCSIVLEEIRQIFKP